MIFTINNNELARDIPSGNIVKSRHESIRKESGGLKCEKLIATMKELRRVEPCNGDGKPGCAEFNMNSVSSGCVKNCKDGAKSTCMLSKAKGNAPSRGIPRRASATAM